MLRGVQKKIIFVNMSDSKTFESAYFIMRDGGKGTAECDMVKEANRIVSGALPEREGRRGGWKRFLVLFAAVLLSALLGRLSWFIF